MPATLPETSIAASAEAGAERHVSAIGELIRSARQGKYTLEELAQRADISSGLISQIERGQGNPSLTTLLKLAYALDLPLGHFFQGPPQKRRMLVRKDERMKLLLPQEGHQGLAYELLTPDFKGALAMFRTQVPGGWNNQAQPFIHRGEECIHVLSGDLTVTVADEAFQLRAGDSLTYDSALPHWYRNSTRKAAQIVTAATPPII